MGNGRAKSRLGRATRRVRGFGVFVSDATRSLPAIFANGAIFATVRVDHHLGHLFFAAEPIYVGDERVHLFLEPGDLGARGVVVRAGAAHGVRSYALAHDGHLAKFDHGRRLLATEEVAEDGAGVPAACGGGENPHAEVGGDVHGGEGIAAQGSDVRGGAPARVSAEHGGGARRRRRERADHRPDGLVAAAFEGEVASARASARNDAMVLRAVDGLERWFARVEASEGSLADGDFGI